MAENLELKITHCVKINRIKTATIYPTSDVKLVQFDCPVFNTNPFAVVEGEGLYCNARHCGCWTSDANKRIA